MKKVQLLALYKEAIDEIDRLHKADMENAAEIRRLGAYGSVMNARLAAVHAALNSPYPEVAATPRSCGSPANIPGYSIKREGV